MKKKSVEAASLLVRLVVSAGPVKVRNPKDCLDDVDIQKRELELCLDAKSEVEKHCSIFHLYVVNIVISWAN